jgi:hypothetical protein
LSGEARKTDQAKLTAQGDSLLMLAYRCWHAGFDYGDAECWQYAWTALSNTLGGARARHLLSAVEDFVRCLRLVSGGPPEYYPPPCCRMSASEQQVLELLAALQAGEADVHHRIEQLCGDVPVDGSRLVLGHARTLANRLLDVGIAVLADRPAARPPRKHLH